MAQPNRHNKSGNRNDNRNRDNRNRNDNRNRDNSNSQGQQEREKSNEASKIQTQSKTESSNDLMIFIAFLIGIAGLFLANKFYFTKQPNSFYAATTNLKFMKEGELTFLNAQTEEAIINIDIEVAKSSYEIERGLMHRRSLPANAGMLFIFDDAHYRTFWMKNTYVALDILFLDKEKEIFRICKHAEPFSEVSIPSGGKAMYVVEVLAGFIDAYQIHIGDHIEFSYK